MTPRNALIAGAVLALGVTVGGVLFGSGPDAEAQRRVSTIDLGEVELYGAHLTFFSDGGCALRAEFQHVAGPGELSVNARADAYPFNGPRCGAARAAAANAAARDLKFTDAGLP